MRQGTFMIGDDGAMDTKKIEGNQDLKKNNI
jgi:hypothetical protein